jgi:hypothetical protein
VVDPGLPPPPPGNGGGRGRGGNNDEFEALIVVGDVDNPAAGDDELVDIIEDLLNGDDEIDTDTADDADDADDVEEDFDAVIISSSVAANVVNNEYADVEIPVVVMDAATYPEMDMTDDQLNQDFGVVQANEIEIQDENDEIAEAANLEEDDDIEISNNNIAVGFGEPDNDAEDVASIVNEDNQSVLFYYDQGAELVNEDEAEELRLGFFVQEQNINDLQGDAEDLLEAVLLFAITGDAEEN